MIGILLDPPVPELLDDHDVIQMVIVVEDGLSEAVVLVEGHPVLAHEFVELDVGVPRVDRSNHLRRDFFLRNSPQQLLELLLLHILVLSGADASHERLHFLGRHRQVPVAAGLPLEWLQHLILKEVEAADKLLLVLKVPWQVVALSLGGVNHHLTHLAFSPQHDLDVLHDVLATSVNGILLVLPLLLEVDYMQLVVLADVVQVVYHCLGFLQVRHFNASKDTEVLSRDVFQFCVILLDVEVRIDLHLFDLGILLNVLHDRIVRDPHVFEHLVQGPHHQLDFNHIFFQLGWLDDQFDAIQQVVIILHHE